jgi:hypothetical protein
VLAVYMLISQGGLAAGSALWGSIGERTSIETAFLWAGLGTIATTTLALFAKLPDMTADVSPWSYWRAPIMGPDVRPGVDQGPVLVTVEYLVDPKNVKHFLREMHTYERFRRRDGASRWGIFRDVERADVYLETFIVSSWAEHLRQHERATREDRNLEERLRSYVRGEPSVRHLIHPQSE